MRHHIKLCTLEEQGGITGLEPQARFPTSGLKK